MTDLVAVRQQDRKKLTRRLYPGINARITGPFLLIIILVAGIGVFIVTRLVAGSLQERFNNQLLDSARAASNSIVDVERKQLAALRLMVFTEGVEDAIPQDEMEDLDRWLRPIAANAGLDDVIVFNTTGQGVLRLTSTGTGYVRPEAPNVGDWPGVQGVLLTGPDELGDKHIDIQHGENDVGPLFYISAPVRDENDDIVGGISVGMRFDRLAVEVSAQSLSAVVFYNSDGTVLGNTFRLVPAELLTLTPERADEVVKRLDDDSPVEELTLNGTPYQVMYAPFYLRSQRVGLLAVGLPTNFIVDRISTSRDSFSLLFSILFLGIAMLGLLTARSITRPVSRLVDATRAIRDGDLSRRVGLSTPDELGELATSFDHMTNQLVARNAEIETLYLQQLEETAQREAVLTSIGDAVIIQEQDGNMMLLNDGAADLMRLVRPDMDAFQRMMRLVNQPETLDQPTMVELAESYFSVLATPVQLPSEDVLGYVIVFRDITALVEAEKLKDELILQMSHELRTPLTAARGYVDLVKMMDSSTDSGVASRVGSSGADSSGNGSSSSGSYVQGALDSLTILERMINQVIDVSAIISNRFAINLSRFNLAELLASCVQQWENPADRRELELALSLPSNEMWIEGDEYHLTQVVDHLIRNAYSYTLPGGSIHVYAALRNGQAMIYVTDTGVGIPPDELPHVFDRMYRGSSAEAGPTDARGLGLGLFFARHIIEAHRGTIMLDSKLDYGTVVTIELPVHHA
ncbi:MAG: HAMP domain-containing protein [Chloroflexi bacterium]|nr:HAMP domain-containing protein [Chloroflexota bacterium]